MARSSTPTSTPSMAYTMNPDWTQTRLLVAWWNTPVPKVKARIEPENASRVAQLALWGKGSVNEVFYSHDVTFLAVASSLGIYLYNPQTLDVVRHIDTKSSIQTMAISPDGTILASGSENWTIEFWQVPKGTLLRTLEGHTSTVNSVVFSPDGTILASGSWDNTIKLCQVSTGTLMRTLTGHSATVLSVAFSPDGTTLASGSGLFENAIKLWWVSDGELLRTMEVNAWDVESVTFSPDGTTLASGSGIDDNAIKLWRVSDGALLRTLEGHSDRVSSVVFSPDGTLLAPGSWDGTIRFWGVQE